MTSDPGFFGISFRRDDATARRFSRATLDAELADEEVFSWIDVQDRSIEPLNDILALAGMDLVLTNHFNAPEVLPRIVEHSNSVAFYLYEIADPERHLDTSQGLFEIEFERLILIIGESFVITYHHHEIDAVSTLENSCDEQLRLAGKTPAFIAFLLMQRCLYDYAHLNLANDNYLDVLEGEILSGRHHEVTKKVSVVGSNILTLKKLTASMHIVLMQIATKRNPFISAEARAAFAEMLQNAATIRAAIDSSRDLLDGIVGNLQANAANRTSEIARVLTIVSAIILPLTLISGIYGMNFEHMPELKSEFGYFGVLAGMASLGVTLLFLFWRLGWFRKER